MLMLHQPLDVLPVSPGVLMQEVHQFVVLVPDLSELINQILLPPVPHSRILLYLLVATIAIGLKLEQPVF